MSGASTWTRGCFSAISYNCRMHDSNRNDFDGSSFRLESLADCLERWLRPDIAATDLVFLVQRVLGKASRMHGRDLLPLTEFRTESEADALWEKVAIGLDERGLGPGNVRTDVDAVFEELALNAAQHSRTTASCYGIVNVCDAHSMLPSQRTEAELLYIVGISDQGVGIPNSLRDNPLYAELTADRDAILRATDMDVTGTRSQRGAGLHHVIERVRAYRGELLIISGHGFLRVSAGGDPRAHDLSENNSLYHRGTTVLAMLPVPALESA